VNELGADKAATISLRLAGTKGLTKTGVGTLVLSGPNTYTGTTTVSAGTLAYGADNVISSGAVTVNGGTLSMGTYSDSVGQVTVDGGGRITSSGSLTSTSSLYVGNNSSGTLEITSGGKLQNSSNCYLGYNAGSSGTVTVDGAGSTWSNSSNLYVGNTGSGTLNILNGGAVAVTNTTYVHGVTDRINFGTSGGTLTTKMLFASSSQLTGIGTMATRGIVGDVDLVFDASGSSSFTFGAGGTATVNMSAASGNADLGVGLSTVGTLTIKNGSRVFSGSGYTGYNSGSLGTATVNGTGSSWSNTYFYVGYNGMGTLNVVSSGTVSNYIGYIGYNSGSSGTVTVSGAGSTWSNSSNLYLGNNGSATLNVINGGVVSNSSGYIGCETGSSGTVTADGAGSRWSCSGTLTIGRSGNGILNVLNGGTVSNSYDGYIGYNTGSSGTVTVDGAGSTWTNSSDLYVGNTGSGTLNILNGGAVAVTKTTYVRAADKINFGTNGGTLTTKTLFASPSQLTGIGTIASKGVVSDVDLVFATGGSISYTFGAGGTATVDMSAASGNGDLGAGLSTTSALTIKNGSCVFSGSGYLGYNAGSSGTATVIGAGSTWASGNSYVGYSGSGTVNVLNGGTVTSSDGYIGYNAGSNGMVTVEGAGSRWGKFGDNLRVGMSGRGTLKVLGKARVDSYDASIGIDTGSSGTVIVDGVGSTWTVRDRLSIGNSGSGTLSITNGATSGTSYGYIGGASGAVIVNGAGSNWSAHMLYVGSSGTGTLNVLNGATVSSYYGYLGYESGSSATALVEGIGSKWEIRINDLDIGKDGAAKLAIAGGGTVVTGSTTVRRTSLLAIDVGRGSSFSVGGSLINDGTVRIVAGAGVPVNNSITYSPFPGGGLGGAGTWQAVGGKWDGTNHLFTASSVTSGTSGSPVALDLATVERARVTYSGSDGNNWAVGASFVAAASTQNVTFTATGISGSVLAGLEGTAGGDQNVLSGWTFATTNYTVSESNPIYFSFKVGAGRSADELKLWQYSGTTWTSYTPFDLTYDGTYASFTVTALKGYAVTGPPVPEPGTIGLLGVGLLGLWAGRRWRRK
jgi:fibronectin-binding autotransporter adhesin